MGGGGGGGGWRAHTVNVGLQFANEGLKNEEKKRKMHSHFPHKPRSTQLIPDSP